jgi:carbamate kinase
VPSALNVQPFSAASAFAWAAITALIQRDHLVICNGGGGVPVVENANGYRGVEAVRASRAAERSLSITASTPR